MTREEALESGILSAFGMFSGGSSDRTGRHATEDLIASLTLRGATPDMLDGYAVGLVMIATEMSEIARKRREVETQPSEVST